MKTILAALFVLVASTQAQEPRKDFTSMQQVLGVVPASLKLKQGKKWNAAAAQLATKIMAEQVVGKWASLTVPIDHFENNPGGKFHSLKGLTSKKATVSIGGVDVHLNACIYVANESLLAASASKLSGRWLVYGQITRAEFVKDGSELYLETQHSRLDLDTMIAKSDASAAMRSQPAVTSPVGKWIWTDGTWTSPLIINADGTCDRGGQKGKWSIDGDMVTVDVGGDVATTSSGSWAPETRLQFKDRTIVFRRVEATK